MLCTALNTCINNWFKYYVGTLIQSSMWLLPVMLSYIIKSANKAVNSMKHCVSLMPNPNSNKNISALQIYGITSDPVLSQRQTTHQLKSKAPWYNVDPTSVLSGHCRVTWISNHTHCFCGMNLLTHVQTSTADLLNLNHRWSCGICE